MQHEKNTFFDFLKQLRSQPEESQLPTAQELDQRVVQGSDGP
jgi:hypothetical protein